MTEEPEETVELPSRRRVLKQTAVLGVASAGGSALVGSAAAQGGDKVSETFDPVAKPVLESTSYEVKDVGQDSPDLESLTLHVEQVEGREDSGSGRLRMAVEATNTEDKTETSNFRTVPFDVTGDHLNGNGISSQSHTCEILFLNLEGLTIRLLGLRIRLDEVTLLVEGQTGQSNLLGNLLCAIAGLLDPE